MSGRIAVISILMVTAVLAPACTSERETAARHEFQQRKQSLASYSVESGSSIATAELPAGPALEDYLAYAAAHNPQLEAAFEHYAAATEAVVAAGSLPDPRFTYRYFIEAVETRVGPQRQSFGVAQTFPWFGKLELRSGVALEQARAQGELFEAARLRLFYQVKHAYYEYYYLRQALAVTEQNTELLKWLEDVARAKYTVGAARHPDIIRVQIEQGKLADRLTSLKDMRHPLVARLNAALNRPVAAELPWPTEQPVAEQLEASDEQIMAWLRQMNPQLKSLDYKIQAEQQATDLASKDYFPDVTLGVDYIDTGGALVPGTPDSGKDPVMVMASINLPIWHQKYRAGQRQARARYRAAVKQRVAAENTLTSDLQMALYDLRDSWRKIGLYRDTLVPMAEQTLGVTQTAFKSDKADFLDLIEAQQILLEFQLLYERALADHAQRLAQVEMLVGRELPRAPGQSEQPRKEAGQPDDTKPKDQ